MKKQLIEHRLEGLSKIWFKNHYELITQLIGRTQGIYALYDDNDLYYVGKSTNLKGRVRHHLRDRHEGAWTHFSLFLLNSDKYIDELESIIIRIVDPRGNRCKPKGKTDNTMLKELEKMLDRKHKQEKTDLLGMVRQSKKKNSGRRQTGIVKVNLEGLVDKKLKLSRTYKGREYIAYLYPGGHVKYNGKKYTSLSSAGKAAINKEQAVNGWRFWYFEDSDGVRLRLDELRK
ncbi:MAG: GIY-YIG nuclease family protein [Candidatus Gygaella obscura]|nr:GIY-YIG nuclease family protein [Candidatus Gygaella obscura]